LLFLQNLQIGIQSKKAILRLKQWLSIALPSPKSYASLLRYHLDIHWIIWIGAGATLDVE
jgi:hypothetical protein